MRSAMGVEEAAEAIRTGFNSKTAALLLPGSPRNLLPSSAPARIRVTGSVKGRSVRLVPHDGTQNSWRPTFHGKLTASGDSSELRGEITPPPGTELFFKVWLAGCLLFMIVAELVVVGTLIGGRWDSFVQGLVILILAPLVPLGGLAIRGYAVNASQRSALALQDWLRKRLNTELVEPHDQQSRPSRAL
jgi:hypothetical protein